MKKYYISKSRIHGRGLFALEDIEEGEKIVEYLGEKITKAESNRRGTMQEENAKESGCGAVYIFQLNSRYDIDGNFDYNDARLINHSCETNCEAINFRGHIWIVAKRDIKKGEELFYNYAYDFEHFFEHPCKCGSSNCIGYIVAEHDRGKLKRFLANKRRNAEKVLKKV